MPQPPDDDDPAADWPERDATRQDAIPRALTVEDTPARPAALFAGYDAAWRDGERSGIYKALLEGGKILAKRNTPGHVDQFNEAVARRLGVPWPPPT